MVRPPRASLSVASDPALHSSSKRDEQGRATKMSTGERIPSGDEVASATPSTASTSTSSSESASPAKPAYPPPTAAPTQTGAEGLRYDFNLGARVLVPEGNWR